MVSSKILPRWYFRNSAQVQRDDRLLTVNLRNVKLKKMRTLLLTLLMKGLRNKYSNLLAGASGRFQNLLSTECMCKIRPPKNRRSESCCNIGKFREKAINLPGWLLAGYTSYSRQSVLDTHPKNITVNIWNDNPYAGCGRITISSILLLPSTPACSYRRNESSSNGSAPEN